MEQEENAFPLEPSDKMVTRQEITVFFPYNKMRNSGFDTIQELTSTIQLGHLEFTVTRLQDGFISALPECCLRRLKEAQDIPVHLVVKNISTSYIGGYVVTLSCRVDLSRALARTLVSSEQQWVYEASTQVVSVEAESGRWPSSLAVMSDTTPLWQCRFKEGQGLLAAW